MIYAEPRYSPDADGRLTGLFHPGLVQKYWQLVLHEDSHMYYSFMTPLGCVHTHLSTDGSNRGGGFCQSAVESMLANYLFMGLLAWLDDTLLTS